MKTNCETCEHRTRRGPDADQDQWCYMFRDEPKDICMQHTGYKNPEKLIATFIVQNE